MSAPDLFFRDGKTEVLEWFSIYQIQLESSGGVVFKIVIKVVLFFAAALDCELEPANIKGGKLFIFLG